MFYLSDDDMEAYLADHHLPNEWDYFDPAKADARGDAAFKLRLDAKPGRANEALDVGQRRLARPRVLGQCPRDRMLARGLGGAGQLQQDAGFRPPMRARDAPVISRVRSMP